MFALEDIVNIEERYEHIDRHRARLVPSSSTHGVLVSLDRYDPELIRIALIGRFSGRHFQPSIKAHNALTPGQARCVAKLLLGFANEIEGTN